MASDSHLTKLVKRAFAELGAIVSKDTYVPFSMNLGLGQDLSIERKITLCTGKT